MHKPLGIVATLALLGASLFPMSVSAQTLYPAAPAICTQIEPIYRRVGVSFYGGDRFCNQLAAFPNLYGWPAEPLDPGPVNFPLMCGYSVTTDQQEFALVWYVNGFQLAASQFCYGLRANGATITFIDPAYS